MIKFVSGFFVGMLSLAVTITFLDHLYNSPKYSVGDCMSNGLFFEKIIEIRKFKDAFQPIMYVTEAYFGNGKRDVRKSTVSEDVMDHNYVKSDAKYCK